MASRRGAIRGRRRSNQESVAGGRRHYDPPTDTRRAVPPHSDTRPEDLECWDTEGAIRPSTKSRQRTLHRAVNVCGGLAPLAKNLGVSADMLATWLDGNANPPVDIYIKALDLVAGGRQGRRLTRRSSR